MARPAKRMMIVGAPVLATACALVLDVEDVQYGTVDAGSSLVDVRTDPFIDGSFDLEAGTDPCDLDRDLVASMEGTCGGSDCDDHDSRVHPDAGFVSDIPPDGSIGDWNCDGVVTPQFGQQVTLSCVPADCEMDAGGGYVNAPPACGTAANFAKCVLGKNGGCGLATLVKVTQGCR